MKHRTGMLLKRGRNYYCRWVVNGKVFVRSLRDEAGRSIQKKEAAEVARAKLMAAYRVADETEALQSVAAQLEGKRAELTRLEEDSTPPLEVSAAWCEYLTSPDRPDSGDSTLKQYKSEFRRFTNWLAKEHAEVLALRDVTPKHAAAYAQDLSAASYKPSSFNQHIGFLRLLWTTLAERIRGNGNPWAKIRAKTLVQNSRRELTIEELRTVCVAATGELQNLFALGLYTGLRLGDCATLRWGEVDLVRGIIRRVPMKTARRKSRPVMIPIHATLSAMLEEIPKAKRHDDVLPQTAAAYRRDSSAVAKTVAQHFEKCGIRTHTSGTGFKKAKGPDGKIVEKHTGKRAVVEVGFHSLRHSFVSLCRAANAPLSVVESIVGHSNPAMTRLYTHTGEAAALAAVQSLPSVLSDYPALPSPSDCVREANADYITGMTPDALQQAVEALRGMTASTWASLRDKALNALEPLVTVQMTGES